MAILDDCSGIRPRRHRKPDTENQKGVCDDTFSAMSVLLSNHVGELLTRLAGGRLMVLVACTAEGIWLLSFDSSRVPLGSHAPKSKAPHLFLNELSASLAPRHCGGKRIAACSPVIPVSSMAWMPRSLSQRIPPNTGQVRRTGFRASLAAHASKRASGVPRNTSLKAASKGVPASS